MLRFHVGRHSSSTCKLRYFEASLLTSEAVLQIRLQRLARSTPLVRVRFLLRHLLHATSYFLLRIYKSDMFNDADEVEVL
jgi:hypothetical protein